MTAGKFPTGARVRHMDNSPATNKIQVVNPATRERIAELDVAGDQDVARAVDTARKAQVEWQKKSFAERKALFHRLRDLVWHRL